MDRVRTSRFLSLVLRHDPGRFGLELDHEGWVSVDALLAALSAHGHPLTRQELAELVRTNDKQRFAWDEGMDRVRANQGHSFSVDLGLAAAVPPDVLYHGTPVRNAASILRDGLNKQARHAVHLSPDVATAHRVGARRGRHVVLAIRAASMHAAGHGFVVSENGVWLTETVPPRFIFVLDESLQ
jgi:putative RNA 2'-phosphotransferase